MLKLTLQWNSSEFLHWLRHEGTGTSPASLVSVSLRMSSPWAPAMLITGHCVRPASDVSRGRGDTDTGSHLSTKCVAYSDTQRQMVD